MAVFRRIQPVFTVIAEQHFRPFMPHLPGKPEKVYAG